MSNLIYNTLPLLDEILKRDYKHVIVMLLDSLGINVLSTFDENSIFHKQRLELSAVFPPTTVAATNAFYQVKLQ